MSDLILAFVLGLLVGGVLTFGVIVRVLSVQAKKSADAAASRAMKVAELRKLAARLSTEGDRAEARERIRKTIAKSKRRGGWGPN